MPLLEVGMLGQTVSRLGMGCGSLGSRVDRAAGVAALQRAFDGGVRWYDVAPSYGDGRAETILGDFLQGHRHAVAIVTKVGIAPPQASGIRSAIAPVARKLVATFPGARSLIRKMRPQAQRLPLTGDLIEDSIVASLRRLRTESVDVLALHDPSVADLQRDDVLAALERVRAKGYAKAIGVAGDLEAAIAGLTVSDEVKLVQVANSPFESNVARIPSKGAGNPAIVTHSVFGHENNFDRMTRALADPKLRAKFMDAGYASDVSLAAGQFLIDYALAANSAGVVLLSMYKASHSTLALSRLNAQRDSSTILNLAADLLSGVGHCAA